MDGTPLVLSAICLAASAGHAFAQPDCEGSSCVTCIGGAFCPPPNPFICSDRPTGYTYLEWKVTGTLGCDIRIRPGTGIVTNRAIAGGTCSNAGPTIGVCAGGGVVTAYACDSEFQAGDCSEGQQDSNSAVWVTTEGKVGVDTTDQGAEFGFVRSCTRFCADICAVSSFIAIGQTISDAIFEVDCPVVLRGRIGIEALTPAGSGATAIGQPAAGSSSRKGPWDDNWEMYLAPTGFVESLQISAINTETGHRAEELTFTGDTWFADVEITVPAGNYSPNVRRLPAVTNGRLDFNGDGRFNIHDIAPWQLWAESLDSGCPDPQSNCPTLDELIRFNLTGSQELGAADTDVALEFIIAGLDAGVFGDLNDDDVADCADAAIQPPVSFTAVISSEDDSYKSEYDFDLDGTIDSTDLHELYRLYRPTDFGTVGTNPGDPDYLMADGNVDGSDLSKFVELFLAGDPRADVNTTNTNVGDPGWGEPDGVVNGADLTWYSNSFTDPVANGICPNPS
ncbi:MAG: GC-type dockerin domain-anchored protein [Planctomycetota bacterium]